MSFHLWATIGRLVETDRVPPPSVVGCDGQRLTVKVRAKQDVDAWRHTLGLPPAIDRVVQYGAMDFLPEPGWCGFTAVYVYCDLPGPVRAVRQGVRR